MNVDANKLICGIRPAVLKGLLQKERFDTPTAMSRLQLSEPAVTNTLRDLERMGWIAFAGTEDYVDCWRTEEQGFRLTATRLMKRIPLAEGRRVLGRLIDEVRAANNDKSSSRRVQSVLLFGSLLKAQAGDTIGDIDLVVRLARRELPEDQVKALEAAETALDRDRLTYVGLLYLPDRLLMRRLKKVSIYLSFHPESDIRATSAPYQQIYCFDLSQEREVTADSSIQIMQGLDDRLPSQPRKVVQAGRRPRPWPTAPTEAARIEMGGEDGLLAQHLWMNNAELSDIGTRIRLSPAIVQAYLSSRTGEQAWTAPATDASLKSMLLRVLPENRTYSILVSVSLQRPGGNALIDIEMLNARGRRLASLRRVGRTYRILGAPADLVLTLEYLDRAAAAWSDAMRSRMRGLGADITVWCNPSDRPRTSTNARPVDLRPLTKPMLQLLDRLWKKPRGKYDGWDKQLSVSLGTEPIVQFQQKHGDSPGRSIRDNRAGSVMEMTRTLYQQFSDLFDEASWSVHVSGYMLDSGGDG